MRNFFYIAVILLAGCATGESMQHIQSGMTKEQVIATLGRPDGYSQAGDTEALKYTNRLTSGWSWDKADYSVILKNGKVSEYGAGQVRPDSSRQSLVIVPLR